VTITTTVAGESFASGHSSTVELAVATLTAGSAVVIGDLVILTAVAEESSTLTNNTAGWTLAGTALANRSGIGDLCRMYVWYIVATHNWDIHPTTGYKVSITHSDTLKEMKFIGHHIKTTESWGGDAVTATMGTDSTPAYPSPGLPPTYEMDGITLSSFDDGLLRVAVCNDNGDEGTFDASQSFAGHTRLMILTGGEVGMISLEKDSVAAGAVSALTFDTISVVGGEVDAIAFANIKLREGGGGSSNMMLLGVG
tara:strand:+ start:1128 stop:1889 length:762 start_codon:yes stop_codon:yes gene_type:complete